uniref:UDP-N-acetylglucosamine diphosphorylase n=1 Tax=Phallusia mammillata TaxID=59560 RepID=A0A6F9DWK2_9ASCI|nr:UDP-N-acetylhexosamine pyrophosphorylase [Phallusia mammillata]
MATFNETFEKLKCFNQEHLLAHFSNLSEFDQNQLLTEINSFDFGQIEKLHNQSLHQSNQNGNIDALMEPVPIELFGSVSKSNADDKAMWEAEGLRSIADGKVAVLLLAGGQGTRLGVNYPKGMYNIGLPSSKTLYQIKAERIRKLQELAFERFGKHGIIPWYIMTSDATRKQTQDFFEKHEYFGLKENQVKFFEQFTLPCLDFQGKVLLANPHKLAVAPDGNGGLYKALTHWKILDDMERRGIECTHVHCVDNILIRIADPRFIGFCRKMQADCGAKVVEKSAPHEAVGVVCKVDGVYQVVEYSEVSEDTACKKDKSGRLVFNAGNICNHYFTTDFLKKVCGSAEDLPHHVAKKKIPHVNENGAIIKPDKVNGIKMEKFVFDVFKYSKKFVVFDVPREDEFSPLKNAEGAASSSPTQARWALTSLHHRRIVAAGGRVEDSSGCIVDPQDCADKSKEYPISCEISPLLSYDGEGLAALVEGKILKSPVYLDESSHTPVNGSTTITN